ncbi:hypothetical protein LguiA_016051 [Lonicera macranthoides]
MKPNAKGIPIKSIAVKEAEICKFLETGEYVKVVSVPSQGTSGAVVVNGDACLGCWGLLSFYAAEAMALLEGLKLVRAKGVKLVKCCSDAISVINQAETILHMLRDYLKAQEQWVIKLPATKRSVFFSLPLHARNLHNIEDQSRYLAYYSIVNAVSLVDHFFPLLSSCVLHGWDMVELWLRSQSRLLRHDGPSFEVFWRATALMILGSLYHYCITCGYAPTKDIIFSIFGEALEDDVVMPFVRGMSLQSVKISYAICLEDALEHDVSALSAVWRNALHASESPLKRDRGRVSFFRFFDGFCPTEWSNCYSVRVLYVWFDFYILRTMVFVPSLEGTVVGYQGAGGLGIVATQLINRFFSCFEVLRIQIASNGRCILLQNAQATAVSHAVVVLMTAEQEDLLINQLSKKFLNLLGCAA